MTKEIVTAELDLEQFANSDSQQLPIEFDVWSYWYEHGFPVDSVIEAHSAVSRKSNEENSGHVVAKVETLEKPLERADAAVDDTTVWCCDCKGYQFHYSVDLEDYSVTEWGACPHIEAVSKVEKAKSDDNQTEL